LASSSHNGALLFGLLAGAAAGAACAIWNATESGEKLRGEALAMVDAALGRTRGSAASSGFSVSASTRDAALNGSGAIESSALSQ